MAKRRQAKKKGQQEDPAIEQGVLTVEGIRRQLAAEFAKHPERVPFPRTSSPTEFQKFILKVYSEMISKDARSVAGGRKGGSKTKRKHSDEEISDRWKELAATGRKRGVVDTLVSRELNVSASTIRRVVPPEVRRQASRKKRK